ncbi:receptor-type tyrosine-protein phosphatase U-like [Bubalus bubalis]|uniref:receptor-type tyrosine-protein phosphatase U-like n=1 Tax=Bubalus bubalis TaxID=89462 RepID=UPI001D0F5DF7|nr:receptor-type tyrosine-protein phosphatase U-like [Bubalus bubalis]
MTKATVNYRQEKTHMMSAVDRSFTDHSTLQEDEQLGLSFMDTHGYSPRGDQRGGGVTEASSLLGGSPRRPCGRKCSLYHTGPLHPTVRVADLLQHINQMKTAEGYGFKQDKVPGPVQLGPLPRASLGSFLLHPSHQVVTEEIEDGGCKGPGCIRDSWGCNCQHPCCDHHSQRGGRLDAVGPA